MDERAKRISEYEILDNGGVKGITPQILTDLKDIASKYGIIDPEDNLSILASEDMHLDSGIYVSTSTKPENKGLIVAKNKSFVPTMMIRTATAIIFWDPDLTVPEVETFVNQINGFTAKIGLYDPVTNQRFAIPTELRLQKGPKYRVEEFFKSPGSVRIVLPGEDPQKALREFDHPELLEVSVDPFGGIAIHHMRDKEYVDKRKKVVTELLEEKGITDKSDIEKLDWKDIVKLREEIEKRLKEI